MTYLLRGYGVRFCQILLLALVLWLPGMPEAHAQAAGGDCATGLNMTETCTYHPFFRVDNPCYLGTRVDGILQSVVTKVYTAISTASTLLFAAIIADPGFRNIVYSCLVLMTIFFAVAFMFGIVQLALYQVIIRLVKIGLIVWLISPAGWFFLNDYIIEFFNSGTNYLISAMIAISQGQTPLVADLTAQLEAGDVAAPFQILETAVNIIFSPRMFVTMLATATTPPYGILVALALGWSIVEFIKAILQALQVYCLSLIVKALLFGIAPIFFVFLLFERTKPMFQGWLNQLVNFSLQPILLFAFLAFFSILIQSSAEAILAPASVHACYTKSGQQGSSPLSMNNWVFVCAADPNQPIGENGENGTRVQPYQGMWDADGPTECGGDQPAFPVSIVNILIFLLIVHLATQVASVVTTIAAEMSSGVTKLDQVGNGMNGMFGGGGRKGPDALDRQHLSSKG